ncbi:hypothetical protein JNL27_08135 [bacterium]|nr:hypothetical protein [bacterium]
MKMFIGNKSAKSIRDEDKLWAGRARKYEGIFEDCEVLIREQYRVLIIFHFNETKDEIQTLLHNRKRTWVEFNSALDLQKWIEGYYADKICMVCSDRIVDDITENDSPIHSEKNLYVIVAEHYPLFQRDEDVTAWTNRLSSGTVCYHESLDSELMKLFGSDKILSLLEKMNWDKNTFMSHSFITKAVENVQKTISEKATGDVRSDSAEKWFEYNYPPLNSIQS